MNVCVSGWIGGWAGGRVGGWVDGRVNGSVYGTLPGNIAIMNKRQFRWTLPARYRTVLYQSSVSGLM